MQNRAVHPDLEFREEKGLVPDLWVPAADAVNYAVAAVRSGTIPTEQPLSQAVLQQAFVPENAWPKILQARLKQLVPIALIVIAGSVWAFYVRKRPRVVAVVGVVWLVVGIAWIAMKKLIGYGIVSAGAICLVWGGINMWRARRAPNQDSA